MATNVKYNLDFKFFLFFFLFIFASKAQSITGKWKTIDDATKKPKAIIEIYEKSGKFYGKIVAILNEAHKNKLCENCSGTDKNKPLIGLVLLKDLEKDDEEYSGGKILDPETGKEYKCTINIETPEKLKVRGYIGFSLLGRTQYWYKTD